MVDWTKPLRNKNGEPVRVLCENLKDEQYPCAAAVEPEGKPVRLYTYTKDGVYNASRATTEDLENVLPDCESTFDYAKPFKTRDGRSARLIRTLSCGGNYPFMVHIAPISASCYPPGALHHRYNLSGRWEDRGTHGNAFDLVNTPEVPTPPPVCRFVLYRRSSTDELVFAVKPLNPAPPDLISLGYANLQPLCPNEQPNL